MRREKWRVVRCAFFDSKLEKIKLFACIYHFFFVPLQRIYEPIKRSFLWSVFLLYNTHNSSHLRRDVCSERRCKSTAYQKKTPPKSGEAAINLLFVTNITDFRRRNVRTPSHFTIVVVRKILIHQVVPFTDKLPFEVTERESYPVTLYAFYSAYYKQDFEGLFYYEISNIVGFIFITIHRALFFARQRLFGDEERRLSVYSSGPRNAYNIDRCRP